MSRLKAIEPDRAEGNVKVLLDAVNEKYGTVPNLARTLANSPAALQGYLAFGEALESGVLSAKLREQIALTVSAANGCGYCVAILRKVSFSSQYPGHQVPQREHIHGT